VTNKKQKKYHTFSSKAGTRPTIPTTVGTVIEEVRAIYAPPKFLDPISTFASRVYWKFVGKCPAAGICL